MESVADMPASLLLVEDDDAIAAAMRLHLEDAGYSLRREADGLRGLVAIAQQAWDLVLLDVMLPGTDGWDICRHLRAHHAGVPVIMLSARATETQRVLGLELGADDYLAKPFSMLELVARVRALLRRQQVAKATPAAATILGFGDFILDIQRRELLRSNQVIPLTLREFELLRFLVKHPGQSFNRQDLLDQVWSDSFDGYEHTVNSHINRLRMKIEIDPRNPRHIKTVWGIGYRFDAEVLA
jgi:DNA-binding response OmpR family regulator